MHFWKARSKRQVCTGWLLFLFQLILFKKHLRSIFALLVALNII